MALVSCLPAAAVLTTSAKPFGSSPHAVLPGKKGGGLGSSSSSHGGKTSSWELLGYGRPAVLLPRGPMVVMRARKPDSDVQEVDDAKVDSKLVLKRSSFPPDFVFGAATSAYQGLFELHLRGSIFPPPSLGLRRAASSHLRRRLWSASPAPASTTASSSSGRGWVEVVDGGVGVVMVRWQSLSLYRV